jgi:hypothetical protein
MSTSEAVPKQRVLYINIPNNGGVLMDIFSDYLTLNDVLKKISQRLNQSFVGHGLFCPSRQNKRRSRFLEPTKTLNFYPVKSGVWLNKMHEYYF